MIHKPNLYYKNIFTINYEELKNNNIKYLLFDIDNTIGDGRRRNADSRTIELFNVLKKDFNIILVSNALPHRVKNFAKSLEIDDYYSLASKPLTYTYNKIIAKYNIEPDNIAAIGDQLYTDIKGANKNNITSILVDKISTNESLITKFNRIRENKLLNKSKIIERGKYDE